MDRDPGRPNAVPNGAAQPGPGEPDRFGAGSDPAGSFGLFERVLSLGGTSVWNWDLADDRLRLGRQSPDLLGLEPGSIPGTMAGWDALVHPEDLAGLRRSRARLLDGSSGEHHAEYRIRNAAGAWRWIEEWAVVGEPEEGSSARLVSGIHRDVTERRAAQSMVVESERRFRTIVEAAPVGIYLYRLEEDGRLVFSGANPAADKILGVDNTRFIGLTLEEAFPPLRETEVPSAYRRVCTTGEPWHAERIAYEDERIKGAYEVHAFQTAPGLMAVMFSDITERKRTEEAVLSIAKGVSASTGSSFFRSLVSHLGEALDADICFVGELAGPDSREVQTIAVWTKGGPGEPLRYELEGSPCDTAVAETWCTVPRDVQRAYPRDALLAELGIEAYCGTRLTNSSGAAFGLMVVLFKRPLEKRDVAESMLRIFAIRASAELERRRGVLALRDERERLQLALDAARMGTWEWEVAAGKISWSADVEAMFGMEQGAFEGTYEAFMDAVHPDDRKLVQEAISRILRREAPGYQAEFRTLWPDGTIRWIAGRGQAYFASDGTAERMLGTVWDVTGRHEAEALLHRQRLAIEQARDGIAIFDGEGTILYANSAFAETLGFASEKIVGRGIADLSVSNQRGEGPDEWLSQLRETGSYEGFHERRLSDGSRIRFQTSLTPMYDETGKPSGIIGITHDVTAEEDLQQRLRQAERMETIGRLAGGIAHDFNNFLSPIVGYAEMLLDDLGGDDTRRAGLTTILEAAERARDLTGQLLAFSRKQVLEMRVLDLNAVVSDLQKIMRRTIRENVVIEVCLDPSAPRVRGDRLQIEQVILNLALNAQDAMRGGGTLSITTGHLTVTNGSSRSASVPAPGTYVVLTVRDTGAGMDAETRARIFEPFFTTKGRGQGTGLGLSTVYGIVQQHRGTIDVESAVGEGTSFAIYLPQCDETTASLSPADRPSLRPGGTETVVVVEDNDLVRNLACSILRRQGYQVIEAGGAEECIARVAGHEGQIHLLLADVVMPEMNGRVLYERLLAVRPGLRVLYMSGYTDDVIAQHGVLEEGVEFLQKPFPVQALLDKVRGILDR